MSGGRRSVLGNQAGTGFDFGVLNYSVTHDWINPSRFNHGFLHGEHPVAQFPEPLRGQLTGRINALADPLGQLSFDKAGTASGGWFIEGAPGGDQALVFGNDHMLLWLARYTERRETRIAFFGGDHRPNMPNRLLAVDAAAPSWEDISPESGRVAVRLWNLSAEALPSLDEPAGVLLVELLDERRLRVEWFDTHDQVDSFTAASRIYER